MKFSATFILMTFVLVSGCVSSTSQGNLSNHRNTPTVYEMQQIQAEQERVNANWHKLHSGMTYDEVDALLGINDPAQRRLWKVCREVHPLVFFFPLMSLITITIRHTISDSLTAGW